MGTTVREAPRPKSPPAYPDFCGKHRLQVEVQSLNREIGFLEEELHSLEDTQPASRCCKEVHDFVGTNPDPLIPLNRKVHKSCWVWRWIRANICLNFSWVCCSSKCSFKFRKPSCSCTPLKKCCCNCDPRCCRCHCSHCCCCDLFKCSRCHCPQCRCRCSNCCCWNLFTLPCLRPCCCACPSCFSCADCFSCPRCSCPKCSCGDCFSCPRCSCPKCSCGCVFSCPNCTDACLCLWPKCSRPCCVSRCLCP